MFAVVWNSPGRDMTRTLPAQGALDCKYLASRYEKGRTAVTSFMEKSHKYLVVSDAHNCHADLIEYQSQLSNDKPFLGNDHKDFVQ